MPGMAFAEDNGIQWRVQSEMHAEYIYNDRCLNLSDPATLGCLLALVRKAWDDECCCVMPVDMGPGGVVWVCCLTAGGAALTRSYWHAEAAALVAALEAAP